MSEGEAVAVPFFRGRPVGQVGIVVRDVGEAVERYLKLWGPRRWVQYTYGPELLRAQTFRGAATPFSIRLALSGEGPQVELIQPVDGPGTHAEWLERHGEGIHHLGFYVPSIEETIATMTAAGTPPIQTGLGTGPDGDGGFAYFDATSELGILVEAIEVPGRRRTPERVWE